MSEKKGVPDSPQSSVITNLRDALRLASRKSQPRTRIHAFSDIHEKLLRFKFSLKCLTSVWEAVTDVFVEPPRPTPDTDKLRELGYGILYAMCERQSNVLLGTSLYKEFIHIVQVDSPDNLKPTRILIMRVLTNAAQTLSDAERDQFLKLLVPWLAEESVKLSMDTLLFVGNIVGTFRGFPDEEVFSSLIERLYVLMKSDDDTLTVGISRMLHSVSFSYVVSDHLIEMFTYILCRGVVSESGSEDMWKVVKSVFDAGIRLRVVESLLAMVKRMYDSTVIRGAIKILWECAWGRSRLRKLDIPFSVILTHFLECIEDSRELSLFHVVLEGMVSLMDFYGKHMHAEWPIIFSIVKRTSHALKSIQKWKDRNVDTIKRSLEACVKRIVVKLTQIAAEASFSGMTKELFEVLESLVDFSDDPCQHLEIRAKMGLFRMYERGWLAALVQTSKVYFSRKRNQKTRLRMLEVIEDVLVGCKNVFSDSVLSDVLIPLHTEVEQCTQGIDTERYIEILGTVAGEFESQYFSSVLGRIDYFAFEHEECIRFKSVATEIYIFQKMFKRPSKTRQLEEVYNTLLVHISSDVPRIRDHVIELLCHLRATPSGFLVHLGHTNPVCKLDVSKLLVRVFHQMDKEENAEVMGVLLCQLQEMISNHEVMRGSKTGSMMSHILRACKRWCEWVENPPVGKKKDECVRILDDLLLIMRILLSELIHYSRKEADYSTAISIARFLTNKLSSFAHFGGKSVSLALQCFSVIAMSHDEQFEEEKASWLHSFTKVLSMSSSTSEQAGTTFLWFFLSNEQSLSRMNSRGKEHLMHIMLDLVKKARTFVTFYRMSHLIMMIYKRMCLEDRAMFSSSILSAFSKRLEVDKDVQYADVCDYVADFVRHFLFTDALPFPWWVSRPTRSHPTLPGDRASEVYEVAWMSGDVLVTCSSSKRGFIRITVRRPSAHVEMVMQVQNPSATDSRFSIDDKNERFRTFFGALPKYFRSVRNAIDLIDRDSDVGVQSIDLRPRKEIGHSVVSGEQRKTENGGEHEQEKRESEAKVEASMSSDRLDEPTSASSSASLPVSLLPHEESPSMSPRSPRRASLTPEERARHPPFIGPRGRSQTFVASDITKKGMLFSPPSVPVGNSLEFEVSETEPKKLPHDIPHPLFVLGEICAVPFSTGRREDRYTLLDTSGLFTSTLTALDRTPSVQAMKVGVLYMCEDQKEEEEILGNRHGSSRYYEFLDALGDAVPLSTSELVYTAGLDQSESHADGDHVLVWKDDLTHLVFHVATFMPTLDTDPSCNAKKRHIGNDSVNILFFDGSPIAFDTIEPENIIASHLNFVMICVCPLSDGLYRVIVRKRTPDAPDISLLNGGMIIPDEHIGSFVRLCAMDAILSIDLRSVEHGRPLNFWGARLRFLRSIASRHAFKGEKFPDDSFAQNVFGKKEDTK